MTEPHPIIKTLEDEIASTELRIAQLDLDIAASLNRTINFANAYKKTLRELMDLTVQLYGKDHEDVATLRDEMAKANADIADARARLAEMRA